MQKAEDCKWIVLTFWNAWCAKRIDDNMQRHTGEIDCILFCRIGEKKPDCPDWEKK